MSVEYVSNWLFRIRQRKIANGSCKVNIRSKIFAASARVTTNSIQALSSIINNKMKCKHLAHLPTKVKHHVLKTIPYYTCQRCTTSQRCNGQPVFWVTCAKVPQKAHVATHRSLCTACDSCQSHKTPARHHRCSCCCWLALVWNGAGRVGGGGSPPESGGTTQASASSHPPCAAVTGTSCT